MTKHYMTEFKNFDNAELFDKIEAELSSLGFEDTSWFNDACPNLSKDIPSSADDCITIFIDFKNHELSEYPEERKSGVLKTITVYCDGHQVKLETDDPDLAIAKAKELPRAHNA